MNVSRIVVSVFEHLFSACVTRQHADGFIPPWIPVYLIEVFTELTAERTTLVMLLFLLFSGIFGIFISGALLLAQLNAFKCV